MLDLESGEARLLNADVAQSWYSATGHLVYVRPDGGVFAVPFDLGALELAGAAVPVLEGVKVDQLIVPDFALSPGGMLMMIAGPTGTALTAAQAVWVARDGTATPIDPDWTFDPGGNVGWVMSPDARRLAVKILSDAGDDVWIKELEQGPLSRLTFHGEREQRPGWTPDGQSVTFVSDRAGQMDLYMKRADGTGPAELLLDLDVPIWEASWSPDGTWLVVRVGGTAEAQRDILGIRPGTDSVPVPLAATEFQEIAPALSPDVRWLAYASDETGRSEVYVRPFPDTDGGKWQVSTDGGRSPLWAHSGRELFYVNGAGEMVAAQVVTTPSFSVGERRVLFPIRAGYVNSNNHRAYNVSPDDQRFLMVRFAGSGDEDDAPGALIVVENFFEELKAKVGN